MSFIEQQFPTNLSFGARGGPAFLTNITATQGGQEYRDIVWSQARAEYDVSHAARNATQFATLLAFFRAVRGRAHGFRFKDWSDYQATTANGVLDLGVGTGLATYQLGKAYTAGTLTYTRSIRKPITGLSIFKAGVTQTAGIAAGNYAIDLTTGVVTFVATSAKTISAITKTNPGQMTATAHGFTNGQVVYLSGIGGMTQLNGTVVTVSGATTNTFTIGVNTTGYGTYTTGGTASLFPQPSQTLTWSGEFDVPVRFDIDKLPAEILDKSGGSFLFGVDSVPLIEIRT